MGINKKNMSNTLNEARMPSLADQIAAEEEARLEALEKAKVAKKKEVKKKK